MAKASKKQHAKQHAKGQVTVLAKGPSKILAKGQDTGMNNEQDNNKGFFASKRNVYIVLGALILLGIITRINIFQETTLSGDTYQMMYMGKSFLAHGEFRDMAGGISHHFSPLYPVLLGITCSILGYNTNAVHILQIFFFIVLMVVTYLTMSNVFNPRVGLITTAFLCIDPMVYSGMGSGKEDVLVMIFVIMTLFGIMRGIKNSWWMIVAGIFAGLAFLTKASTGYLFILGGFCGLGWRFYYQRFSIFLDKGYMTAAGIFGLIVGAWTLRNIYRFGSINTSQHTTDAFYNLLRHPGDAVTPMLLIGLVFMFYFLERIAFVPDLSFFAKNSLKEQRYGGIFLFFATTFIIAIISAVSLTIYEGRGFEFFKVYLRYICILDPIIFLLIALSIDRAGLLQEFSIKKAAPYFMVLLLMFVPIPYTANNVSAYTAMGPAHGHDALISDLKDMISDYPIYTSRTDVYFYLPENATIVVGDYDAIPPGAVFAEYTVPGMTPIIEHGAGDSPIHADTGIYRKGTGSGN